MMKKTALGIIVLTVFSLLILTFQGKASIRFIDNEKFKLDFYGFLKFDGTYQDNPMNNLIACRYAKFGEEGNTNLTAIVYVANIIGSLILVAIMYYSKLWEGGGQAIGVFSLKIAAAKANLTFWPAFFRGIGCNWLVCLAVWMALSARHTVGKVFAIFFPIMAFVASGFEHSVANMFFIPMGMALKGVQPIVAASGIAAEKLQNLDLFGFLIRNEVPVTLGNIVGGAFFVGVLYWFAYVRKSKKELKAK